MPVATTAVLLDHRPQLYVWMAVAFFGFGLLGFTPTYWRALEQGALSVSPLIHVHPVVFNVWLLLFLGQTSLGAAGRTAHHRRLGLAGVVLAPAMVLVGHSTAVESIPRLDAAGLSEAG